ncbi:hypothetical protein FNV43_RR12921 [Rhamnella rubrinervis]|uniref:Uncharacterized protein n=1 Tax=Rhamnella rubrinervis TaxID=2594499 RepID=A0A8K0MD98_9ROSA|nr:hypothetical protein FNV43_RR12921 [Rhamnella rubrinervis]
MGKYPAFTTGELSFWNHLDSYHIRAREIVRAITSEAVARSASNNLEPRNDSSSRVRALPCRALGGPRLVWLGLPSGCVSSSFQLRWLISFLHLDLRPASVEFFYHGRPRSRQSDCDYYQHVARSLKHSRMLLLHRENQASLRPSVRVSLTMTLWRWVEHRARRRGTSYHAVH